MGIVTLSATILHRGMEDLTSVLIEVTLLTQGGFGQGQGKGVLLNLFGAMTDAAISQPDGPMQEGTFLIVGMTFRRHAGLLDRRGSFRSV